MPYGAHGTTITRTQTLADYVARGPKYPLGHEVVLPADSTGTRTDMGEQVWVYVYNDEAATPFAQGHVIARDSATAEYHGVLALGGGVCATGQVIGVAQHAIPFGGAGFILKRGVGEVMAGAAGITQDNAIIPSAAAEVGRAVNAVAVTNFSIGFSTETVGGAALATCYINCPG